MKSRFSWELVLIGAGIIFFAFYLMVRDRDGASESEWSLERWSESAPAPSEESVKQNGQWVYSEEHFQAMGLATVKTNLDVGNVYITSREDEQVLVRILLPAGATSEDFRNLYMLETRRDSDALKVNISLNNENGVILRWLFQIGRPKKDTFAPTLEIFVPEGALTFDIDTKAGNLNLSDIGGDIKLDVRAGNIRTTGLYGEITADVRAGNIVADSLSGRATLQTRAGNIRISESDAHIKAQTAAGNITYYRGETQRSANLETRIGNINVYVPADAAFDVNLRATNISFPREFSFSGDRSDREVIGKIAGGGPQIEARTRLGDLNVSIRN